MAAGSSEGRSKLWREQMEPAAKLDATSTGGIILVHQETQRRELRRFRRSIIQVGKGH